MITSTMYSFVKYGRIPEDYSKNQITRLRKKCEGMKIVRRYFLHTHDNKKVVSEKDLPSLFNQYYHDTNTGYVGIDKLHKRISEKYYGVISREYVTNSLRSNTTNQRMTKPPAHRVVRPIISNKKLERIQIDLIDMSPLAWHNGNNHWILCAIDHYTKFTWAFPIKKKGEEYVVEAITSLLTDHKPFILQSDNGKEFEKLQFLCDSYMEYNNATTDILVINILLPYQLK
jgi:hypothetical protein